jgi:hypothetical protein
MATGYDELPDGRIVGSVDLRAGIFGNSVRNEIKVAEVPWRAALDVYLAFNGNDFAGALVAGLITRIYARTRTARALLEQRMFFLPSWAWGDAPRFTQRDWLVARARSYGAEVLEIWLSSGIVSTPTNDPTFQLAYCAFGTQPCAEVEPRYAWKFGGAPVVGATTPNLAILQGPGTLHDLWIVNPTATDAWAWLFDVPNTIVSPYTEHPLVAPIYVPPNGKGGAFLEFGAPRGLQPRYGITVAYSTSGKVYTPPALLSDGDFFVSYRAS